MLRKYVRQLNPIQEKYIAPIDKVQSLLEAYSFFPKSEEEISKTLSDFPHENVQDIINYDPRIQVNAVGVDSTEQGIRIEADVTYIPFNVSERMKFNFDRDNSVIN